MIGSSVLPQMPKLVGMTRSDLVPVLPTRL
jgi:hypothetical protein